MNLATVKAWANQHERALIGSAAAGVAGIALYERHRNGGGSGSAAGGQSATPVGATAGLTLPDTLATDIENQVQDELNAQQSYINTLIAKLRRSRKKNRHPKPKPKPKPKPRPHSGPTAPRPGNPKPRKSNADPRRNANSRMVAMPAGAPRRGPGPSKRDMPR